MLEICCECLDKGKFCQRPSVSEIKKERFEVILRKPVPLEKLYKAEIKMIIQGKTKIEVCAKNKELEACTTNTVILAQPEEGK